MDPLTALSLACNVIQVIDFGATMIAKCKELYKDGASAQSKDIESMAEYLANVSTDLKLPETSPSAESAQQGCQEDEKLAKLAQQCSEIANDLIRELQKLAIQGTHRKRDALLKAVKESWNKTIIESIENRLEQHRKTLNTLILIDLRQHARKVSFEQSKAFKDLDRKLQNFINAVAGDREPFAALKEWIQNENASCNQYFIQEVEKLRVQIACKGSYKNLLESLYFPDIHARQEGIEEAHKKTFNWIFEKSGGQFQPWHDFMHWLESGHGTYWISGKAGSGKSTLMNFISQDLRTNAALKIWSGTNEVLLLKFFFWNAGTELQKSSRGLLRSIIYQIMEKTPELMPVLERYMNTAQQRTQQLPTWTERRLLATLQYLLRYGLQSYRLCIFVDGLDEFSGHQDDLLELTRDFRQYSNIKICLSSRPYRLFRDEFGSSAMLKLQELTEPDIREYVSNKLPGARCETSQVLDSSPMVDQIADEIVRRAEGVFLWVKLAVRDQLEGFRNCDGADQLLERLRILPDEIEGIYINMLQRIDKVYRKEAAQYLHLVLSLRSNSLFRIALAGYHRIDSILLCPSDASLGDLCRHCHLTRERIATTCQGILEVWETNREGSNLPELESYDSCSRVSFLHRTALDFFKDNEQARRFLDANAFVSPHLQVVHIKELLAELVVFRGSDSDEDIRLLISTILKSVCLIEEETEVAQLALMGLLDQSLSVASERSRGRPLNVHWCRAWGFPAIFEKFRFSETVDWFGTLNIIPTDLPGFAASVGIGLYVVSTIDSQSERRTCSTADYLLGCALSGLCCNLFGLPTVHPCRHLRLIRALLERGANPQMRCLEGTAWGFFLRILYSICCHHRGEVTTWGSTLRAFLTNGANKNEMVGCCVASSRLKERTDAALVKGPQAIGKDLWLHLSPLMITRLCFGKDPLEFQVEDAFIAQGASLCSECTRISVVIRVKEGRGHKFDITSSKKLWDDLMETLKRRPEGGMWALYRQDIEVLGQEMDLRQLHDQARREYELQKNIIQEDERGEDELNTDIGNISDVWSIVASDSSDPEINEPPQPSESPS